MTIPKGRMWAYCQGVTDKLMHSGPMFRQQGATLIPQGFTGAMKVETWTQEDRQTYMTGYQSK